MNTNKTSLFSAFSLTLILVFFLGCTNREIREGNTIITAISSPVASLDPLLATSGSAQNINQLIHLGLVESGSDLRPVGSLAKSFKQISAKVFEFELNENCKFHNGETITSEDVRKTILAYQNEEFGSPHKFFADLIKEVKIINNKRLQIETTDIQSSFLVDLPIIKIIPVETYSREKYASAPIGAGPFRVVKHSSNFIKLGRFNNNCTEIPDYDFLEIKVVRNDTSKYLKLKDASVDIVLNEIDYRKPVHAQKYDADTLEVKSSPGISYQYIGVNFNYEPLKDIRIRTALALSLDIHEMIKYKLQGFAQPSYGLLANSNWYSNKKLKPLNLNIERAKTLLDEAGYFNTENNKPVLKISLKTNSNKIAVENAQVIAAHAKRVGIDIEHMSFEWGAFYEDVKSKNTQLFTLRWKGVVDPSHFKNIFHTDGSRNRTFYSNKVMDDLIEKAQKTIDPIKRKEIFDEVQSLAFEDLPYINLWHNNNLAIYRKEISNVILYPNGHWRTFVFLKRKNEKN